MFNIIPPVGAELSLAEGQANRHKTDMKKLEDAFHYFPDMVKKGNYNFRTTPMFTLNYNFIFACPSVLDHKISVYFH